MKAPASILQGSVAVCLFLRTLFLSLLLASCRAPDITTSRPDPAGGLDAMEAPMLSAQVAAGTLPPVAERLPEDPLVVTPWEQPGLYGGTWRVVDSSADVTVWRIVGGYAPLVRWNADASALVPGTASRWELSEDGSSLTFHLRRGMRWSDGVEYTSADLLYWWDVVTTEKTALTAPFWTRVGGKSMTVEAPDRYTVVFRFAGPNHFAALHVASTIDWQDEYNMPAHYMKRFDPRFTKTFSDFTEWEKKNKAWINPERPTLCPWRVDAIEDGGNRVRLVRNPYYWMTDHLGRQLPYIDRVTISVLPDGQLRTLSFLAGEVDAQFRMTDLLDYSLYAKGRARGDYRVLKWERGSGARNAVVLNWDEKDPVLRALIREPRFRRALSLGIDRAKCNEIAWHGLGRPQQATISRQSWHFRTPEGKALFEKWAASWAEHDPEKANAMLDELGLTKRDAEGYRLRPDGRRLSLLFDVPASQAGGPYVDEAEIVAEGWKALGIETVVKSWALSVTGIREGLGEYTVGTSDMAEMDLFAFPDWVFPTRAKYWHPQVGRWFESGGKEGEAPTGPMKELLDLYARIQSEPDVDKAHARVLDAIRIHVEQGPFVLGTVADLPELVILKNNFRNVPEEPRVLGAWSTAAPATSFPETFYFAAPRKERSR